MAGAFDPAAFDPAAFDVGAAAPVENSIVPASVEYAVALPLRVLVSAPFSVSLPLAVGVADGRVFESSIGRIVWALTVTIGGVDYSGALVGEVSIEAAEDAARIAELTVLPASAAALAALKSAPVTIDVTVTGGGYSGVRRRFTGVVESLEFTAASREARLTCRDGRQERIRACGSAAEVQALLADTATVSPHLTAWNDAEPDPMAYFTELLGTVPGCTYIDGSGVWRMSPWTTASPARTYTAADMFDPGPTLTMADRADTPSAIVATLTHRFYRLHNAECRLRWQWPEISEYANRGIPFPSKSMVAQAVEGLGDWLVNGEPLLVSPEADSYTGPGHAPVLIDHRDAPLIIRELDARMYRRWYQEVTRRYTVTVGMGGDADIDSSVARELKTDYDASEWESGRRNTTSLGIYSANPPPGPAEAPELTGYEALPAPWPDPNRALDHFAGLSESDVELACAQVVAEAVRQAAAGRREQSVVFERPVDLRLEIGAVVGVDALGVAGVGQVARWVERYDHDTGACVGSYTLAMPSGAGTTTGGSVSVSIPAPTVVHGFLPVPLGNWIGGDSETLTTWVNPDTIAGFLCNTLPTSEHADPSAPYYETQFRIVMPEIPASVRDPLDETVPLAATINLPDSGLTITF